MPNEARNEQDLGKNEELEVDRAISYSGPLLFSPHSTSFSGFSPICPPEREKENPGNEGGQLEENTTNEVAPTASKRHVTYCHPISTTPQC